jgi:RNA polymerase sigma-70 factor, ECF subfamily
MNHATGTADGELISATLGGDEAAFGQLVLRYQDRLFNGIVRVVRCEATAADVVQDAFVLAWRRLESFAGRSGFYTWLFQIARNQAISRIRARKPALSLDGLAESPAGQLAGNATPPDLHLRQEEDRMLLEQALGQLSDEHRTIIVLREMEDMDYEQIATVLEVPVGTVRSRLFRARMQLRDELLRLDPAAEKV